MKLGNIEKFLKLGIFSSVAVLVGLLTFMKYSNGESNYSLLLDSDTVHADIPSPESLGACTSAGGSTSC